MPLVIAAGIMAASTIGGALISKQKAPAAAAYAPVDPQAEQQKAIAGNIANEGDIEALLNRSNAFTQNQANSMMEQAVPGYSAIASKFMKQADGLLTDPYNLPTDVATNLTRLAAEKGISIGSKGQASDYSLLRDFGINELQYGQNRIGQAKDIVSTIASLSPRVNPMSPMSLYVTPGQAIGTQQSNNQGQYNATQGANNADAAASNANAAMWGNVVTKIGGMAGGVDWTGRAGVGAQTTYADFLKNNPGSSAATGG